ncbi:MAG: CocE/NonD family hydrolase [Betaproteobacteria bacterium]|nr:CocE/NonD family hydrolase [Betaproteobacteria bacterium]
MELTRKDIQGFGKFADQAVLPTRIVFIAMRDGVKIAGALYLPKGRKASSRLPTLLAASPYRFDNNVAPALPVFLWRETGPIDWYLEQGYAFLHVDVRGTGRSGGEFRYMDRKEQRDIAEVVEWAARQKWSNGRVGGIGQSYYARMQWFMAIQNPKGLACVAPYDGNVDTYRSSAYTGGIPGEFPSIWYNNNTRIVNNNPASGPPRLLEWDYPKAVRAHPTYDTFWKARAAAEMLHKARVPVFSIGVWRKVDLHLSGNIVGFERAGGPKKLLVFGSANVHAAVQDFASIQFHETYLLPFYDRYLKGKETNYESQPAVRYFASGADTMRSADAWPPTDIRYRVYHLGAGPTGSVTSFNDGALGESAPAGAATTSYDYPDPGWRMGVVGFGPDGRPDPARRVLTFTSAPLDADLEVTGPIKLVLHASTSRRDTDFIVKLSEQYPQPDEERRKDINPRYLVVTKGWLRASHRALDARHSSEYAPWYTHTDPQPLTPGKVYRFEIAVMPTAHRFARGSRIRLEIANGDSSVTEFVFAHEYPPNKIGRDTLHHDARHPSQLFLPVRNVPA